MPLEPAHAHPPLPHSSGTVEDLAGPNRRNDDHGVLLKKRIRRGGKEAKGGRLVTRCDPTLIDTGAFPPATTPPQQRNKGIERPSIEPFQLRPLW